MSAERVRNHDDSLFVAQPPVTQSPATRPLSASWSRRYRWTIASTDLVVVSLVLGALLLPTFGTFVGVVALVGSVILVFTVGLMHGYDSRRAAIGMHEYSVLIRASWVWASLAITGGYLTSFPISPSLLVTSVGASGGALVVVRWLARQFLHHHRHKGRFLRRALLIGEADQLTRLGNLFHNRPEHGIDVVGACVPTGQHLQRISILGDVSRAVRMVAEHQIHVVIVSASGMDARRLRRLCWQIEEHNVELMIAPDIQDVAPVRVALQPVSGTPLLTVAIGPSRLQLVVKSIIDRLFGVILLAVFALPLGLSALAVRVSSDGPALFTQERIGRGGESFTMYKFRTMRTDAEQHRGQLLHRSEGNVVMFKLREDPRVTAVGKVLRRFSLDELPQLLNVLRGDMSLVGPRPPLPEEVAAYSYDAYQRLRVKPGITGLWQVSGRSDLDWDATVRLDLQYVDNWSVFMDLSILIQTVRAVVGGKGAY